jgi:hypothetical protein
MKGYSVTRTCQFGKVGRGLLAVGLRRSLTIIALAVGMGYLAPGSADGQGPAASPVSGELLPTGARITPTAAEGAIFQPLNPDLPDNPRFYRWASRCDEHQSGRGYAIDPDQRF